MKQSRSIRPLIFWEGFPACALLIDKVLKRYPHTKVVATRAAVPFQNLEEYLNFPIYWIDSPDDIFIIKDKFSDINFVIHTGWNHKGWLKFGSFLRKRNNAKIVVAVDNRFKGNLRQAVGAIYFRIYLKFFF